MVVQSTGGLYEAEQAQSQCVRMLESGPAAGVIGTKALCDTIGISNAIAFDMGGPVNKAAFFFGAAVLIQGRLVSGLEMFAASME